MGENRIPHVCKTRVDDDVESQYTERAKVWQAWVLLRMKRIVAYADTGEATDYSGGFGPYAEAVEV